MTTDTVGGVLGYALDLCRVISEAGGEVWLVTLGPRSGPELEAQLGELPRVRRIVTDFKLEWMDDPFADVKRAGELLLRLERELRPDVVHLNGYAHGALPFVAPKLVVAHSCVLSWWQAVHGEPAPAKYDEYRAQVTRGLRGATVVVAPSAAMLRMLQVHYTPELRTLVIPNAAPKLAQDHLGEREGVCTAGRIWDAAKNIPALLRAARDADWTLSIAGPEMPPDDTALKAGLTHDVPANVRFLGKLSRREVARLFAESAVYVHPARYEPFGLSVLEAAQAGCALVLSDIASLRELWDGAASFVELDDVGALRDELTRLQRCPQLRRELARRARVRAAQYGLAAFRQRYLKLYADLALRRAAARAIHSAPRPASSRIV